MVTAKFWHVSRRRPVVFRVRLVAKSTRARVQIGGSRPFLRGVAVTLWWSWSCR